MCGIAGMLGAVDARTVRRMTHLLAHRGPDGEGLDCPVGQPFGFGHRRLAILDLSPAGAQPMSYADGRFTITYNGEVYNFQSLRHILEGKGHVFRSATDTEVLLAAWAEWGVGCLARLNGMFAFGLWDRHEQTFYGVRDRLGIKPFYWADTPGGIAFASEPKPILATDLVNASPDPEITHNPWHYPVAPRTGFLGIRELPPGHILVWRDGHVRVERWWGLPESEEPMEHPRAASELAELLESAVALEMIADVPVGAMLSGGLDSTTVVALMTRHAAERVRTISIRFRKEDMPFERMPDDERFAEEAAGRFGCEHTVLEISPKIVDLAPRLAWHLGEPIFDPAAINTFLIAEEARRRGITVLLSGMGGDEVFGGYRKHLACLLADRYQSLVPGVVRRVIDPLVRRFPVATSRFGLRQLRWIRRFFGFASLGPTERFLRSDLSLVPEDYANLFLDSAERPYATLAEVRDRATRLESGNGSYLNRMCRWDTTIFLPDHNLAYTDKATMALGVEARPPLIDHRIVEFAFRLRDEDRIRGSRQKAILRDVAANWIPRDIVERPKANFGAPLRAWIRRDLREMVDDMLSESAVRRRGLYRPEAVKRIIRDDRTGRADHAHLVWNLLSRELWFEAFIDGGGKALAAARSAAPAA